MLQFCVLQSHVAFRSETNVRDLSVSSTHEVTQGIVRTVPVSSAETCRIINDRSLRVRRSPAPLSSASRSSDLVRFQLLEASHPAGHCPLTCCKSLATHTRMYFI